MRQARKLEYPRLAQGAHFLLYFAHFSLGVNGWEMAFDRFIARQVTARMREPEQIEELMTAVVCVGIAVWDQIFAVDRLPDGGGKFFYRDFLEAGGGPAATAAAAASRLGADVAFWGRVGGDAIGTRIVEDLTRYGVDITGVRRIEGQESTLSAVVLDGGGERMILTPGDNKFDPDPSWLPLEKIAGADALLVDARWPEGAGAALESARLAGIPSILDADTTTDMRRISPLVAAASHTVFSADGLRAFAGSEDSAAALRSVHDDAGGTVAVTRGGEGCSWIDDRGDAHHLDGFEVEVVDTLGAGDVFHGALAVALAERRPFGDAVRFASATAAIKCTRPGGRAGTPDRAEVEAFLREHAARSGQDARVR